MPGVGLPFAVHSTLNSGVVSSTCLKTNSLAFSPLGTLMPHAFLAVAAEKYSGVTLNVSWHIQDNTPLNLDNVEIVEADEKPILNDRRGSSINTFFMSYLVFKDRKSTRLNSSHSQQSRMPSSA